MNSRFNIYKNNNPISIKGPLKKTLAHSIHEKQLHDFILLWPIDLTLLQILFFLGRKFFKGNERGLCSLPTILPPSIRCFSKVREWMSINDSTNPELYHDDTEQPQS